MVTQAASMKGLVVEKRYIPFGRETGPNGDEAGFVERIDHQQNDGQIKKGKAQNQRSNVKAGPGCVHFISRFPGLRASDALEQHNGHDQQQQAGQPQPPTRQANRGLRRIRSTMSCRSSASDEPPEQIRNDKLAG